MAFFSIADENTYKTSGQLKVNFSTYCSWCWYHGFGNCDSCHRYYSHLLYLLKMREFKMKRNEQEGKADEV